MEINNIEVKQLLERIQNSLFTAGADLSAPYNEKTGKHNIPRISGDMAVELEKEIDKYDDQLEELKNFILPGGTKSAALLHICRTICRRAEREVVELKSSVDIGTDIIVYLNRLSDLFFVLARFENKISGQKDVEWKR
jgi:cob(I)alamin adenosyltransferase